MVTKPGKRYIKQLCFRYAKAGKKEKRNILDDFIETTSYHRKSAIRILRKKYRYTVKPIKRPRKRRYDMLAIYIIVNSQILRC